MFFPVCILSRFGEKCEQICHCNIPGCDVVTGHCNIGKCAEGWAGESCNGTIHLCYWYDKYITDNETLNTLIIHECLVISHLSRENYRRILEKKKGNRYYFLFWLLRHCFQITSKLIPRYSYAILNQVRPELFYLC